MNTIQFSHNWNNKLDNNIFTTIRKWTPEKEDFYDRKIGHIFEVQLKNKRYGDAELIHAEKIDYQDLEYYLKILDTGLSEKKEQDGIFQNFGIDTSKDKVIVLTFLTV